MHTPVNHPLRPFYRTLAGLAGAYLVVFGVLGLAVTGDEKAMGPSDASVLGQRANLTFALVCLVLGVVVLAGVLIGRNVDVFLNTYLGWGFIGIGTLSMLVSHTDANLLNFSIFTCIVAYLVGLVLVTAGLYGTVGARRPAGERHAAPAAGRVSGRDAEREERATV
jgi:hypothetical protein